MIRQPRQADSGTLGEQIMAGAASCDSDDTATANARRPDAIRRIDRLDTAGQSLHRVAVSAIVAGLARFADFAGLPAGFPVRQVAETDIESS